MNDSDHLSVKRSALNVERSASTDVDADNPWPGLASFTEDARGFFFGREKETEELVRLVRRNTLTVLFGQSGLGKSSLLQAGAFPVLREVDFLPLYLRLDHDTAAPALADQIKTALVDAFKAVGADAPAPRADESLWEYFHRKDIDIWSAKNRLLTPVLAFDQFEEIFTLGRADETRRERGRAFLTELADLVENRPPAGLRAQFDAGTLDPAAYNFDKPSCQVILSLREDFLPDLEGLKNEMRSILHNRMRVKRLNGTQALEIVSRPAPHLLAEGVAERIVEFVAGARGGSVERLTELEVEPALLSVICRELNERRRANGSAQITADLVSGNRREILTDFYERSVSDLPEAIRTFVEDHLLTKSGFRDNLALETALEFPGVTRPLLDLLVARRLVRLEDRLGVQRVELTHDVLAEVIRASRDSRQQRLGLEQARERERHVLATAARHARRHRWVIAGLAVIVFGLSVGAVFGIRAQRVASERASRTDFTLATGLFNQGKATEAIAYLVRAAHSDPHNAVVGPRLLSALATRNFLVPEAAPLQLPAGVAGISCTPDGAEIFVLGDDGIIRVLDPTGERLLREFSFPQKALGFAFARDNPRIFAAGFEDNTILICDTATGNPISPPIRPLRPVSGVSTRLSPDGRWLAAGSLKEVWLWEVATGELRATLPLNRAFVAAIDFSPDSQRIATCSWLDFRVWSVPDGAPVTPDLQPEPATNVYNAVFSPDNRLIAVALRGGVELRDATTGALVHPRLLIDDITAGVIFTSDGKRLVTSGSDLFVRVWDVSTGQLAFPPLASGSGDYNSTSLRRDGRVLLTRSREGFTRAWDMTTGKSLGEPALQQDRMPHSILSPDGSRVLIGTRSGSLFRLSLTRGATRPLPLLALRGAQPNFLNNLGTFLPFPPLRVRMVATDRMIVLDAASGREVAGGMPFPKPIGRSVVRRDNRFMIAWTSGKNDPRENELWESVGTGMRVVPLSGMVPNGFYFNFSETGNLLSVVSDSSQQTRAEIRTWDLGTTKLAGPPITYDSPIHFSASGDFSPDGKRLAAATIDGTARVWDIATGKLLLDLKPLPASGVTSMIFSPDGTRIATTSYTGEARLWDAMTGAPASPVLPHRSIYVDSALFSGDGRYLATQTPHAVHLWDARDGRPVGEPIVDVGVLSNVVPSPFNDAGTRLLTSSADGTVRLWDARTGLPLAEPMKHDSEVRAAFSPGDGRFMLGANRHGAHIWALPPDVGNAPTPEWLLRLATICAGKRVTAEGTILDAADEVALIDDLRREVAALPDHAPFAAWGKWFFADPATRPLAPGFTITPAEADQLTQAQTRDNPVTNP